jgi:hypothetical protein
VGTGIADRESTEEDKKFISGLRSTKYGAKKQKMKGKERVVIGGPENCSPIEGGLEV